LREQRKRNQRPPNEPPPRPNALPHARRPHVTRGRVQEVGVRADRLQRITPRRGRVAELFSSPKHRRFRSRSPELWDLGERAPQPTLHLVLQRGSATRQDLEIRYGSAVCADPESGLVGNFRFCSEGIF